LGGFAEGGESLLPDAVEVGAQGGHAVGVEPVDAAGALGLADDQAAVFEHAQVLGDGRSGDRQLLGQVSDRAGAPSEQLEDGPSGGVAEQP
jgi:hypothetical protein